jgi:hypothetical protein
MIEAPPQVAKSVFRSAVSRNKSQLLLGKSPINSFLGYGHRF